MNRKAFRKIFLPVLIFIFSVLVLGQSGWACDEPEYPNYQCYEQLDIKWVDLDLQKKLIYIWGKNFNNGGPPVITLAGIPLAVDSSLSNEQWIVAALPSVPEEIPYGQYSLRVSTGDGHKCKDKYSVKIHPVPPEKPPCEQPCPATCECPQVCKGEKGDPGPEGPQGPPGITGWDIAVSTVVNDKENFQGKPLATTAFCKPDYKVTGGGFSQYDLDITVNGPLDEQGKIVQNGWRAGGTIISSAQSTITVYAICACVNPNGCK